ncbi:MAG: class I SAM-dependent methyltransferase family protein [Nitrospinae bacterium]|nr:class I SAM-dependent methyltransferase family protein [Nitrospinota bacterium]
MSERVDVHVAMDELIDGLRLLRNGMGVEEWDVFSRATVIHHPCFPIVHQDPFTRRNFEKPRGYDGDAKTLDYIYGVYPASEGPRSKLGIEIFNYTTNSPASKGVRARKRIITDAIDAIAKEVGEPRIFSLACGHLREAHDSRAIQEGRIGELVAMDFDKKSLALVADLFSGLKVKTFHGSVKDIIAASKSKKLGKFHLIYASGLYDYLSQRVAARLTSMLFDMLLPGGKIMLSNFLPNIRDLGYMETFMDWRLIYRNESQINDCIAEIGPDRIFARHSYVEENNNIIFLEVTSH